jgi:pimeloyl-ACP methyl ester carboxylesterase
MSKPLFKLKPMFKSLSLLLLFAGICAGTCSSAMAAPTDPASAQSTPAQPTSALSVPARPAPVGRTKVYLLRGFMNVFSLGMDQLAEELRQRHISAEVSNHLASSALASEAAAECKSGKITSIVIAGHSLGATAAVSMAEELQKAGVRVALVMMLDPITRSAVPSNVQRLKNFYLSDGVGATVQPGEHFRGSLQNVDLKGKPGLGHISMATSPILHKQMLEYILGAAGSRCR